MIYKKEIEVRSVDCSHINHQSSQEEAEIKAKKDSR
jgi:hypothetical protein